MTTGNSSLQRVLTTLSHREPDRVPLFLLLTTHGAKELGLGIREYFSRPEYVAEGQLRLQRKFGHGFRASVSDIVQKAAFATGVPPHIYAFHRYTGNSAFLSDTQESQFPSHHGVKLRTFRTDLRSHLRALYAQ